MDDIYIADETFSLADYTEKPLSVGEYEHCSFNQCNFYQTDLSSIRFSACTFTDCNLSLVKLHKTAFQDAIFKNCKMVGLHFDHCNKFGLSFHFDGCQLNLTSFYQANIKKTHFKTTLLHEVDFTECNLTDSVFDHCDLAGALFENTNLEKADFRTSFNYSIDPAKNRIKKSKFSIPSVIGLLDKLDITIEV